MSGKLQIHFAPDMPAATVEVLSPELDTVSRFSLRPGDSKDVDVPSEASFLRVHLASGRVVTLQDPGNLNRTISMASISEGRRAPYEGMRVAALNERVRLPPQKPPSYGAGIDPWRIGEFEVELLSGQKRISGTRDPTRDEIMFHPSESELPFELRIRFRTALTVVRVPGTAKTLTVASDQIRDRRIVVVRVLTSNRVADAISAYLARGDMYSAEAMAEWADQAEELLLQKVRDPFAAAVGGYLLLRLRRFGRLNWAKNLADWFPQLSDGSIIYAWQCAYQRTNESQIREYLQRALQSPLPVFTEGLKLLRDGAHLLEKPQEASRALNRAAGAPIWTSPFTATGDVREATDAIEFDVGYESV